MMQGVKAFQKVAMVNMAVMAASAGLHLLLQMLRDLHGGRRGRKRDQRLAMM